MNKKEILEIRKQFTPDRCTISRICGCYVDSSKEMRLAFSEAFGSLPSEEAFKYFEIFKKTLSGTVGKNLIHMAFSNEEELSGEAHPLLLGLKKSRLTDETLLNSYYQRVIDTYDTAEPYLILLVDGAYDVPGRASDGMEMFDASEQVFEHILCCICPVSLDKPGLCYHAASNSIRERVRDWIVAEPANGFLFPAFNDRTADIHHLVYYSRKADELNPLFPEEALGCLPVLNAGTQNASFQDIMVNTLEEDCNFETVRKVHDTLREMLEIAKDEPDPLELGKEDVKRILEKSGASEERLQAYDRQYEEIIGEDKLITATNITAAKSFKVKTPEIMINVDPDRTDLIEIQVIDGRKCLVVPLEGEVEVNGIIVNE